jgi:CRP-like cAMP-binding protein
MPTEWPVRRRTILERQASTAQEARFGVGAAIVREGEDADALYVLTDGEVEVSARGEAGGPEKRIRVMTAPTYFGEIGVLERIPRTATVTALGPVQVLRIDGDALLDALTASPASSSLMESALGRLTLTHPVTAASFGSEAGIEPEKPRVN